MPMLNFPDLFTPVEMTQAVNKLPLLPLRMTSLFADRGVRSVNVALDMIQGRIVLVENQDRRDNPKHLAGRGTKRSTKVLACAHLPLSDTVLPDDIQGVRGFGTDEPIGAETVINDRMQTLKNSIEMTKEFHRLGAVKGVVYDADGETVLHNLFEVFGVAQKQITITFPDDVPVKRNPILDKILEGKRHSQQKAGGFPISRWEALVGETFYDSLTGHKLVRDAFEMWSANQQNWGENDYRRRGFTYGGITWVEASEEVAGRRIVEPTKAHVYPIIPGMYETLNAPANWMSTVNTVGLPYYSQMNVKDLDRGIEIEVQANPLCICNRPETLVEFTCE